jgi:hypothetical protein
MCYWCIHIHFLFVIVIANIGKKKKKKKQSALATTSKIGGTPKKGTNRAESTKIVEVLFFLVYIYIHCDIDIFLLFLFICFHSFSMIHTLNTDTCACDYSVHTYACCVQFNPHFFVFILCFSITYYIPTRLIMVLPKQPIRTLQMENNPNKTQLLIQALKPIVPTTTVIVKFNHLQTRRKVSCLVTRLCLPQTSVLL